MFRHLNRTMRNIFSEAAPGVHARNRLRLELLGIDDEVEPEPEPEPDEPVTGPYTYGDDEFIVYGPSQGSAVSRFLEKRPAFLAKDDGVCAAPLYGQSPELVLLGS